jgi:hypothetical protein
LYAAPAFFLILLLYGCGSKESSKDGKPAAGDNKQASGDDKKAAVSDDKKAAPKDGKKPKGDADGKRPAGDEKAKEEKGEPVLILAVFGEEGKPQFADVRPGDRITVKGMCVFGFENEVALQFVERYKGKEPAISAVELTRAFAKDRAAAEKKYINKQLVVEGVVERREEFKVMLRGHRAAK